MNYLEGGLHPHFLKNCTNSITQSYPLREGRGEKTKKNSSLWHHEENHHTGAIKQHHSSTLDSGSG